MTAMLACLVRLSTCLAVLAAGCDALPGKPTPAERPARPSQITAFATLYGQNCAGCHGTETRPGAALALHDPVYLAVVDDVTLRRIIADGVPGTAMPAFARGAGGTLTDQQIETLVREMRAAWGRVDALRGTDPPPYAAALGDAERGRRAFQTYCAGCHGEHGTGGQGGGSVVDPSYLALVSNQALRTALIVGRPALGMPDWRGGAAGRVMSAADVADVVAWLAAQRAAFPGQPYAH